MTDDEPDTSTLKPPENEWRVLEFHDYPRWFYKLVNYIQLIVVSFAMVLFCASLSGGGVLCDSLPVVLKEVSGCPGYVREFPDEPTNKK